MTCWYGAAALRNNKKENGDLKGSTLIARNTGISAESSE